MKGAFIETIPECVEEVNNKLKDFSLKSNKMLESKEK